MADRRSHREAIFANQIFHALKQARTEDEVLGIIRLALNTATEMKWSNKRFNEEKWIESCGIDNKTLKIKK